MDRAADDRGVGFGDEGGGGRLRPDFDRAGGGVGAGQVVSDAQADRVLAVAGEGARRARGRAGAGLVGPVAVQVPLVFDDRAVGVAGAGAVEAHRHAGQDRRGDCGEGSDRAPVGAEAGLVLGDLGRGQGAPVDRQVVEDTAREQLLAAARHQVEHRVGEGAGARAFRGLGVGDRFAVDVGHDLLCRRGGGVEHDRVVMPGAGAGPFEEDVVAGVGVADADAEFAARLRRVGVDDEAAFVLVEVVGQLQGERVVVGVGIGVEPELDGDRAQSREVDGGAGGVVDTVEANGFVGVGGDRPGDAEGRGAEGGGVVGADAVGEGGAAGLAEAPVVEQAGRVFDRVRVAADSGDADRDRNRGGRVFAAVVGYPQADLVGAGSRIGEGGGSGSSRCWSRSCRCRRGPIRIWRSSRRGLSRPKPLKADRERPGSPGSGSR